MFTAAIVGATGYTGLELCRLLSHHPGVIITNVYSRKAFGKPVSEVNPHLDLDLIYDTFDPANIPDVDILFLAIPHGESHMMFEHFKNAKCKIIDLSADFRLSCPDVFKSYYGQTHQSPEGLDAFVYGLPEINKDKLAGAQYCASPGCYATGTILGLYPLSQEGILTKPVIVDGKSGVTGAGRSLKEDFLFCEANEALSAYNTFIHRHQAEMHSLLNVQCLFSPHLVPMNRGILLSMYVENSQGLTEKDIFQFYEEMYKDCPFIQYNTTIDKPSTKFVSGSNNCMITVKVFDDVNKIVVFATLDNLIKGAAGQAIQNMNVMCDFDETLGLPTSASYV